MDSNRLLLEFEQLLREVNRASINPIIETLAVEDLRPVAELVARARARYLRRLFDIAQEHRKDKSLPSDEEMNELRELRRTFLDLVDGSQSFETAIKRGYLDVCESPAAKKSKS